MTIDEKLFTRQFVQSRELLNKPLESSDRDHPGPLLITSINASDDRVLIGTLSRGLMEVDNGEAKTVQMRPMVYFINAIERDKNGKLWVGARAKKEEPGASTGDETAGLKRAETPTGPVLALKAIDDEVWIGTDGRGIFRVSAAKTQPS